jgi:hypothetical protein
MNYIVGIGGGLASAVLFYSASRGSVWLSLILFILSPLPSLIAGFGWGWQAAALGGIAGSLIMAIAVSAKFGAGYFLALGVPCAVIAYLAYLGRTVLGGKGRDNDGHEKTDAIDWLPAGDILAAIGFIAAALPIVVLPMFGGTYAILEPAMAQFATQIFARASAEFGSRAIQANELKELTGRMVDMLPAALAGYWAILFSANVYLAGRITRAAGLLPRPWPNLHALELPGSVAALLLAGILGMIAGGTVRIVGASVLGGTMVVLALAGLSVVHCLARHRAAWALWPLYISMPSPIGLYTLAAAAILGIAEPLLQLRRRYGGPPPPSSIAE